MQPPLPSLTRTWHNDTYKAISPERENLSCAGKTIVITGAGTGIGQASAIAFAAADAAKLILVGRTEATLFQTQEAVTACGKDGQCIIVQADVSKEADVQALAATAGTWDILVLNAGHSHTPSSVSSAVISDYWTAFETNVKSVVIAAHALLPTRNLSRATIISVTSASVVFPTSMTGTVAGYAAAKTAAVKLIEYIAAEHDNLIAMSLHPGMIDTATFRRSGFDPSKLPMDTLKLPAHFMVWLASSEADFLNGKLCFANWDVEELQLLKAKIQGGSLLTLGITGWPFAPQ